MAAIDSIPDRGVELLTAVAQNIRLARKRRRWSIQDLADKMFVSEKTLRRLEHGEPGVSIGILVSALWALGLHESLAHLADPAADRVGLFHEREQQPQRVRKSKQLDLDF